MGGQPQMTGSGTCAGLLLSSERCHTLVSPCAEGAEAADPGGSGAAHLWSEGLRGLLAATTREPLGAAGASSP